MQIKVRELWVELRSSLWFIPSLLVLCAVALAIVMIEIDTSIKYETLANWPRLFGSSPDGARGLLSAVAGSMITVAGVTFSITIVALSLAANQYTSRILRNFMSDRANQMVLGIFLGIFVYCLIVLRTIRGGEQEFVPSLGALVGIILAVVGIGYLIFFIHHIATAIQVSSITAAIAHETLAAVTNMFPDNVGKGPDEDPDADVPEPPMQAMAWFPIAASETGYLQHVETDSLLDFAHTNTLILRMERGIGEFVVQGTPLVSIGGSEERRIRGIAESAVREINGLYTINRYRTIDQDAGFGIRQLVDIALKALSPGINETTTAVTCVDYLGSILHSVVQRRIPPHYRFKDGELRVIASGPTFASLLGEAFFQIRQNSAGNIAIMLRMLGVLGLLGAASGSVARRRVIWSHVEQIIELADTSVSSQHDRRVLDEHINRVAVILGKHYAHQTFLPNHEEHASRDNRPL